MNPPNAFEGLLRHDRAVVSLILGSVVVGSWLYLLAGAGIGMLPHQMAALVPSQVATTMPPEAWTPGYAILMLGMWWLMMIAMMLPSAAPMVLLHATLTRRTLEASEYSGGVLPATLAFVGGYLSVWALFSVIAVLAQWTLERSQLLSAAMASTSGWMSVGLLSAAGLWQLTPVKTVCLRQCRSPISFLSSRWLPGVSGAFRMGMRHGALCVGCCWFLMALLFYAGVMNLLWIVGLALFVLAEKALRVGVMLGRATGVLLLAAAMWIGIAEL